MRCPGETFQVQGGLASNKYTLINFSTGKNMSHIEDFIRKIQAIKVNFVSTNVNNEDG